MLIQDEVAWVLETIKGYWPAPGFTDDLARINRDEPKILETGLRERSVELSKWNAVGASLANRTTTPRGTEYDHSVETVVNIRIEGLHEDQFGHIEDSTAFEMLVGKIRRAILLNRSYPDVMSDADDIGFVCYRDLRVENEQDYSHEHRDYYRREFDVRLTGVEELPDL